MYIDITGVITLMWKLFSFVNPFKLTLQQDISKCDFCIHTIDIYIYIYIYMD